MTIRELIGELNKIPDSCKDGQVLGIDSRVSPFTKYTILSVNGVYTREDDKDKCVALLEIRKESL